MNTRTLVLLPGNDLIASFVVNGIAGKASVGTHTSNKRRDLQVQQHLAEIFTGRHVGKRGTIRQWQTKLNISGIDRIVLPASFAEE